MSTKLETKLRNALKVQGISTSFDATVTIGRDETLIDTTPETAKTLSESTLLTWSSLPELRTTHQSTGVDTVDLNFVGHLGDGGMGTIELAEQTALRREVAVKRLNHGADQPNRIDALLREAYLSGRLEHPNIIPIHLVGRHADLGPLVVMKRVHGVPWDELLVDEPASDGPEALEKHLGILLEVCQALAFAHAHRVIHRDIKPSNVMIGEFGEVYLLDWGVAFSLDDRPEKEGVAGTPAYMAPETARVDHLAEAECTDIFLMGATLREILTGDPPYGREPNIVAVLMAASQAQPPDFPDDVPAELAAIVNRACAAVPEDRYPTVRAFEAALRAYLRRRPAITITQAAQKQLALLQERVAAAMHGDGTDLNAGEADDRSSRRADILDVYRRSRFGFEQALELWPDYAPAAKGVHETCAVLFDYEVSCRNADAAGALLPLIPDDVRRAEALNDLRQLLRRESVEVKALRRDVDLSFAYKERVGLTATLVVLGTLMSAFAIARSLSGQTLTHADTVGFSGALLALTCSGVWLLRKRLLRTRVDRALMMLIVGYFTMIFGHRLMAWHRDTEIWWVLTVDTVIFGMMGIGALPYIRVARYLLPLGFVAGICGAIWPPSIAIGYSLVVSISGVAIAVEWMKNDRPKVP